MPLLNLGNINTEVMTTSYIMNAIRQGASEAYRRAIPLAAPGTTMAVGSEIMDSETFANEYVKGLVTTYVLKWVTSMYFENPLKIFKMPYAVGGAGNAEFFINGSSVGVNDYDPEGAEVDKPQITTINSKIHKVNSQKEFKTSLYLNTLKMSFVDEGSSLNMIMGLVSALFTQMEKDEYNNTKNVLTTFNTSTAFKKIATADATPSSLVEKIREVGLDMQFPSTKYITGPYEQTTQIENLIVLTTPANVAKIDVQVLANAFNMGKADWVGRVVVVDSLPAIANIACLVGDARFFNIQDTWLDMRVRENESGRFFNVFLNKDTVYSASPFFNMAAITQAPAA